MALATLLLFSGLREWVGLGAGALTFLATQNRFNDEFVNYFDPSVPFRADTDYISENLTGIYNVEFSVGSGESGGINNPAIVKPIGQQQIDVVPRGDQTEDRISVEQAIFIFEPLAIHT